VSPEAGTQTLRVASEGPGAALEIVDLRRHFGGVHAVDGVTFQVPRGQITGLIGPNGAGKSTVLNMIAGADVPTSGTIRHEGVEITGAPSHKVARRGIIRTFQVPSEFGHMTVWENLVVAAPGQPGASFWGSLRNKRHWRGVEEATIERACKLIDRFEMNHRIDEYAGELSGGQRRLIEIMRALMAEPSVLLLDEPFSGVLPRLARRIEAHLMALRDEEGLTMLMVEHELGAIDRMTDSVLVMAQGKLLAQGLMSEVRQDRAVSEAYLAG
jgi:ABC-type branched-subunit amino acid transport system ATPase component